jgi:hypothetical protein
MSRKIKFRGKVTKGYQESFFKQKFVYGNVNILQLGLVLTKKIN